MWIELNWIQNGLVKQLFQQNWAADPVQFSAVNLNSEEPQMSTVNASLEIPTRVYQPFTANGFHFSKLEYLAVYGRASMGS